MDTLGNQWRLLKLYVTREVFFRSNIDSPLTQTERISMHCLVKDVDWKRLGEEQVENKRMGMKEGASWRGGSGLYERDLDCLKAEWLETSDGSVSKRSAPHNFFISSFASSFLPLLSVPFPRSLPVKVSMVTPQGTRPSCPEWMLRRFCSLEGKIEKKGRRQGRHFTLNQSHFTVPTMARMYPKPFNNNLIDISLDLHIS